MLKNVKNVLVLAALAVSGLVLTSCGDKREDLLESFHLDQIANNPIKFNFKQEYVVKSENTPVLPVDSIAVLDKEIEIEIGYINSLKEIIEGYERMIERVNKNLSKDKREFPYAKDLHNLSINRIKDLKENIAEVIESTLPFEKTIADLNSKKEHYLNLDQNTPLAYTFKGSIITYKEDASLEIESTYLMDSRETSILEVIKTDDSAKSAALGFMLSK